MSKQIKNVFDQIFSKENLWEALQNASRGRRYEPPVLRFNYDGWTNVTDLRDQIYSGEYEIDKYYIFQIHEPKYRIIMSIAFKHRVVQWAIYQVLNPIFVRGYINDSYGCIPGRGVISAILRLESWLDKSTRDGKNLYYLKLDISKYFYRIPHEILKAVLRRRIADERLLSVLFSIIDCKHTCFGLPRGMQPEDVPMENRLPEVGMPIGNLMSQMFANLFLNELDQYCKRKLRIKLYERYMDDVIILSESKQKLHQWETLIDNFLREELQLDLNEKTCIRPAAQGCEFVGFKIRPFLINVRKSTSLRIKRSLAGIRYGYLHGMYTLEYCTQVYQSFIGLLKKTDSKQLEKKVNEEMILCKEHSADGLDQYQLYQLCA